jgi:hypothetical protein
VSKIGIFGQIGQTPVLFPASTFGSPPWLGISTRHFIQQLTTTISASQTILMFNGPAFVNIRDVEHGPFTPKRLFSAFAQSVEPRFSTMVGPINAPFQPTMKNVMLCTLTNYLLESVGIRGASSCRTGVKSG